MESSRVIAFLLLLRSRGLSPRDAEKETMKIQACAFCEATAVVAGECEPGDWTRSYEGACAICGTFGDVVEVVQLREFKPLPKGWDDEVVRCDGGAPGA